MRARHHDAMRCRPAGSVLAASAACLTPPAIVGRLNGEITAVLASRERIAVMVSQDVDTDTSTLRIPNGAHPDELGKWREPIKKADIKPE
jgi:hypothetical protein